MVYIINSVLTRFINIGFYRKLESYRLGVVCLYKRSTKTYQECPICFEKFMDKDLILILECGHMYHFLCIKNWVLIGKNCPMRCVKSNI